MSFKKIVVYLLTAGMVFGLYGCSKDAAHAENTSTDTGTTTDSTTTTA